MTKASLSPKQGQVQALQALALLSAAIGAGIGSSSGVAFGAMIGGDILVAAIGLVIGCLSFGGISVYRTAQSNDQIYS